MFAPRRVPPCLICSVAVLKMQQEGHRPEATPAGGAHAGIPGAQAREGKARSSSGLVDHGGEFHRIENFLNGIPHGQHKAGGELPQFAPGIHQRGRIGQKHALTEQLIKFPARSPGRQGDFSYFRLFPAMVEETRQNSPAASSMGPAFGVFTVISLGKHKLRVGGQTGSGQIGGHIHHGGVPGMKTAAETRAVHGLWLR